jgi:glycosyltransferase involved in cell wall biosynthesis
MNSIKIEHEDFINPLLSIVIPTRNRFKYVKSTILSILSFESSKFELVIQDNSDSDELMLWISKTIDDTRLNYNYVSSHLSFVGNFDNAVSLATGDYVCLIGDDDGLNCEIICVVEWMSSLNIDSLSTRISANYVWENSGVPATKFTKVTGGVLSLAKIDFHLVQSNLEEQLGLFFMNGCNDYLKFGLPKLYQGIVKKECLEKVKEITGNYFGGLSPDIYASITISLVAQKVYVTNYPLIISGVCGESASIIEGLLKKNSKRVEDAPHLRNRGKYEWCNIVPYVYTVETIWADSAIAAIKAMDAERFMSKFNIAKLSAYCIHYNKGIDQQVMQNLSKGLETLNRNRIAGYFDFYFTLARLNTQKIFHLFFRIYNRILIMLKLKEIVRFEGVNDIEFASNTLSNYLTRNNINFSKTNYKEIL